MEAPLLHLALVGTPNSGKTSLFNALTGSRQKVANYPGVTVERKEGFFVTPLGRQVSVVDLPGTYVAQLIVNDGTVDSLPTTVRISTENSRPVANAGPDQTVDEGALVSLSGSFTDPGSADTHTQTWSVVASNGQVISNGSGA